MKVIGWNNGSPDNNTGAGYGIRISSEDRDKYFKKSWDEIIIELSNEDLVSVSLSNSFWEDCIELRSSKIGKWMINNKLAPWKKGNPPIIRLDPVSNKKFRLSLEKDYSQEFSEESFWSKVAKYALQAGRGLILTALTLFFCAMDPDTPKWAKAVIIGALGYFIAVLDVIPDFTPIVGYSDDLGALTVALATVAVHIKTEHRERAEQAIKRVFGKK
jgi:uncharacterized membrane protein YkvA (DUF1232 family)